MASMNEPDLILKQDAGGRVFVPAGRQIGKRHAKCL